ncbi:MAG: helix-turn-helix transcriptional regulator [Hydrogenoanaerobacterium sp.]
MQYHNRLKDLRNDKDMNQTQMAQILQCAQTCISKWELMQTDIPNEILIKIALFFNTSTDYILGLTNESKPYKRT